MQPLLEKSSGSAGSYGAAGEDKTEDHAHITTDGGHGHVDNDDPGAGVGARRCLDKTLPQVRGRPCCYKFASNAAAGVAVSLVNVPLCISLALVSHATPAQGLLTGVAACSIGALLGGSHFNILGPTGALSPILSIYTLRYGPEWMWLFSVVAGLMAVLVAVLALDVYVTLLPSAVNIGFTMGVAVLIAFGQLPNIFHLTGLTPQASFVDNLVQNASAVPSAGDARALLLFLFFFVPLFFLTFRFRGRPWLIYMSVVSLAVGALKQAGAFSAEWAAACPTLRDKYGAIELFNFFGASSGGTAAAATGTTAAATATPSSLPSSRVSSSSSSSPPPLSALFEGSASIAFVAVLETLISGKIADGMTHTQMNARRECLGVGAANLACGAVGGIPATAALARTALNIRSGAVTRVAGFLAALFTLLLSAVGLPLFELMPMSFVAAMLVNVAAGMIEFKGIRNLWRLDKVMFGLAVTVAAVCVFRDPTTGIIVGMLVGLFRHAESVSHSYARVLVNHQTEKNGRPLLLQQQLRTASVSYHSSSSSPPFADPSSSATAAAAAAAGAGAASTSSEFLFAAPSSSSSASSEASASSSQASLPLLVRARSSGSDDEGGGGGDDDEHTHQQPHTNAFKAGGAAAAADKEAEEDAASSSSSCFARLCALIKQQFREMFEEHSNLPPPSRASDAHSSSSLMPLLDASSSSSASSSLSASASPSCEDDVVVYRVIGKLTFINALDFQHRLRSLVATAKHLVVSFKFCVLIDSGGVEALEEAILEHEAAHAAAAPKRGGGSGSNGDHPNGSSSSGSAHKSGGGGGGGRVYLAGVHASALRYLERSELFQQKKREGFVCASHQEATALIRHREMLHTKA